MVLHYVHVTEMYMETLHRKKKVAITFAVHVSQVRMIPDKQNLLLAQALVNRSISSREALAASNYMQLLCNSTSSACAL